MEKKRSKGVILFSILFLVSAVYNFILPLYKTQWVVYPKMFTTLIFPSLMLLISVGLFIVSKWGRVLAILFSLSKTIEHVWNIGVFIYWLMSGKVQVPSQTFDYYLPRVIAGIAIIILWLVPVYYLTRSKVKEQFG